MRHIGTMDGTLAAARRGLRALGAALCLCVLAVDRLDAQRIIGTAKLSGVVLVDSLERPIAGAEVILHSVGLSARSDSAGEFAFSNLPTGRHRLTVRAVGYQSVAVDLDIPAEGLENLDLLLRPAATELKRVDVRAKAVPHYLADFESRRNLGIGRFMDSTTLWTHGDPSQWAQRLVEQTPGLRAVGYGASKALVTTRGIGTFRRLPSGDVSDVQRGARQACYARIIVDGVIRYNSQNEEGLFDVTNWSGPPFVAAEFYTSAQLPAEFNRLGTVSCGALVLWTRR
ncbi:MAG TPA: carboxypeptidase-like regulatory domain-containing protein [Gemmatimonas aurantiaca]|nr:carboxypeptidase-like regulatory domain-containing protein [Gemmatimonas aurantiaca]